MRGPRNTSVSHDRSTSDESGLLNGRKTSLNPTSVNHAMSKSIVTTFYRFVRFSDPAAVRESIRRSTKEAGTRGTVLVAEEGINGTVSGSRDAIDRVLSAVRSLPGCAGIRHRESLAGEDPFRRMNVRLKREIVTMGRPDVEPLVSTGQRVSPCDWNEVIEDDGVVIVDTRNTYEVEVGTFPGAINPGIESFSEFPAWWKANRDRFEGKRIAMFCTGGIRCEKSTSLVLGDGFGDVFQLDGGILGYLEATPPEDNLWRGECFVFDHRVSVGPGLERGSYELCFSCRRPVSAAERASPHYEEGVSCPSCIGSSDNVRLEGLRERQRQVELARNRGYAHFGSESQPARAGGKRQKKVQP